MIIVGLSPFLYWILWRFSGIVCAAKGGGRMNTIEELYYGNITLSERSFRRTGEYAHILQLATRNEEKLSGTLTEAQKEAFGKFKDSTSELSSMTEVTAFTLGFKLGLRLTAEAFVTGSDDQNLMKE